MSLAASYAGRLGLTAWRRKSTLLGVVAGIVLLILCLQYSAITRSSTSVQSVASALTVNSNNVEKVEVGGPKRTLRNHNSEAKEESGDNPSPQGNDKQIHSSINQPGNNAANRDNVQFVQNALKLNAASEQTPLEKEELKTTDPDVKAENVQLHEQFSPETLRSGHSEKETVSVPGVSTVEDIQLQAHYNTYDQQGLYQMGIPYVNLDPRHPYVPEHRLLHLDLKGAPPKVSFLKRLFPLVRQLGATGILLEWEDMFPFTGSLASISATNAYSKEDIQSILEAARGSELEVIPLVQTFGHMEFALKINEFASLREVPESPQALCPSLNASFEFVEKLVTQVMEVHQGARFLHIGCDEVFQMGECRRCRTQSRESLFLSHVSRVANMIHSRYPGTMPIIWDDMLRHLSPQSLEEFHIGELVEPMVWVYAEDVYRFVPTMVWEKYASVFPHIWSASAFKGAFGETLYIPNVKRHLENNLRWLEVMTAEGPKFKGGFRGIAVTGWQRYDHFAVLCELLPAAVPSLAVNLLATSHGYFNQSLRNKLYTSLGCAHSTVSRYSNAQDAIVNLNSDPYLWDKFGRCFFPGASFFKLTYRLHAAEFEVKEYIDSVMHNKGWMTEYNVRRKFSSPLRVDELMAEHPRIYHTITALIRSAHDSLEDVFDSYTISEWVEQRLYPSLKILEQMQRDAVTLKSNKIWPRRPLPPLWDLKRLGVSMPGDSDTNSTPQPPGK
ncbi:hypothetical protein R5R35_008251 [Gryllus longicercus]|uniref:beta-N-acetylhexosaminidase n=1 Tax=Gryllus longicercus TaxID=2509291 RepID=A0AAN9V7N9_9ORTH